MNRRLFIISNRLPINIESVENTIKINVSSGGLITAISSYINDASNKGNNPFNEYYWVGTPCCTTGEWAAATTQIDETTYKYLPVFVNRHIYDSYYNGFSNSIIWPLFHYFPSYVDYQIEYFENYIKANEDFLSTIIRNANDADTVWIHDYHLLPLAGMIREKFPNITIGFFLHIPFPSYELFRLMPHEWQHQMLDGILGADLIGFHTIDYVSHFLKCLHIVLGIEAENNIVKYKNNLIKVEVFPISTDFAKYNSAFNFKEVVTLREQYRHQFEGKKILFSVDRLDYTKGVFSRLKAFEWFLQLFPQYKDKVVLIMVIVPSRDTIPRYAERKKEINEFIGDLNSSIGTITWKPVIYQYAHLNFTELMALYTTCNMALVTPLRDGMNLVSKEFVASRKDLAGVLLLSEMTGAARELTDALLINPNDLNSVAHKIKEGLEMSEDEQSARLINMQKRIVEYDINAWSEDFFTQLNSIKKKQKEFEFRFLDRDSKQMINEKYAASKKRLLLLDYDGTLMPFSPQPQQSQPSKALIEVLNGLGQDDRNLVYIISDRDSSTLDKWLGQLPINLIAEHGAKVKEAGEWRTKNQVNTDDHWKEVVSKLMHSYVRRCPNSFIEEKEFSIVWHFRNAEDQQAKIRSIELYAELSHISQTMQAQILTGKKTIEVHNKGISKVHLVKQLITAYDYDFILACGDDNSDEEIFKVLAKNENAHTIKVGDEASFAKYNLYTPQMTMSLLSYFHQTNRQYQM